jgi:exodeoxyribonuclease VII large subunit
MCTVLTRRFPDLEIRLYPVKVQGPGAKEEIVEGIRFFNNPSAIWKPDVLIVGRGGGSIEDLWAFNEECTVRALAASGVPTISAVGHETDFTLCDFAADVRAGTPSIAAEIAVPEKVELLRSVNDLVSRLKRAPERALEVFAQRIDNLTVRVAASLGNAAAVAEKRLSNSIQRLLPALKDAATEAERRLSDMERRLLPSLAESIARCERRTVAAAAKLDLLDPANPLKRGYSLTLDANGQVVRSAASVKPGDALVTRLADGEVASTVAFTDELRYNHACF